jgi:SP family arabinose:H+ symporter-like MFS transporter
LVTTDLRQRASFDRKFYAFYIAFASLGGFLFEYDLVIISGAQIFVRDQFGLTPQQFGFATSSALLGCIAGPFLGARICDRFGRKATLLFAALLFAVGAVGTAVARDITEFDLSRIFGGIGVGLPRSHRRCTLPKWRQTKPEAVSG